MFGTKDTIEADLNRHFSKYEDPLWDEDENSKKSISVTRVSNKTFDKHLWKFYENSKLVLTVEDTYFTKKQIKFLLSVDGIKFLIDAYKAGDRNASRIKKSLAEKC